MTHETTQNRRRNCAKIISCLFVFLFMLINVLPVRATDYSSSNFIVRDPVINIFGGRSSSSNFQQINAGGQVAIGESTSTNFILRGGFLYWPAHGTEATSTLTAPSSISFTPKNVSINSQTSTAAITPVEVQANAAGWSATLTSTNLTVISSVRTVFGSNTITTAGTYDGTYGITEPIKTYGVKIVEGGPVGTATYQWRVDEGSWTTPTTTAPTVDLEKGIKVNFSGSYSANDEWQFGVDVFPYTGLTVTPSDITVISGSGTGVSKGTPGNLTGSGVTSNAKVIMWAQADCGIGTYRQTEDLNLNIRANSLSGSFQGTITLTIL